MRSRLSDIWKLIFAKKYFLIIKEDEKNNNFMSRQNLTPEEVEKYGLFMANYWGDADRALINVLKDINA